MLALTRVSRTFPSTRIASASGGLPVEVSLIAQLGIGAGDQLFVGAMARQQGHEHFVDEFDEPSVRLGDTHLDKGDATALYSFGVGANGHPFHRHAGHRIFTAISGSGGAQLRFCTASAQQLERDPHAFIEALRYVDIPPDCLFTVRFGGETWHQFAPLRSDFPHPAFFALSCHSNELGGALSGATRATVMAGKANIPALTELLPDCVAHLLCDARHAGREIPTIALALEAPAESLRSRVCAQVRSALGRLRARLSRRRNPAGFQSESGSGDVVGELGALPMGSLLREHLACFDHQDTFELAFDAPELPTLDASSWLQHLLTGFLENRPSGVSRLMRLRNALVKPLGLRTSPLGCPVSSLLSEKRDVLFAGRFPVLDSAIDARSQQAQVVLGADDKHLRFRSCVGVRIDDRRVVFSLGTRVEYRNLFGHFYMAVIDAVHRCYVTPLMLRLAVEHARRTAAVQHESLATLSPSPIPPAVQ